VQEPARLVVFTEDTKSRKYRYVPLTDAAIAAIHELPPLEECPYVFYDPATGKRPLRTVLSAAFGPQDPLRARGEGEPGENCVSGNKTETCSRGNREAERTGSEPACWN